VPAGEVEDGLILFDGVCVLCSDWVDFVIKRDPQARFRFLPIQTQRGRAIARHFGVDAEAPETNVVVKGGQALFKFDAVLAVLEEMPGWRWLTILRHLPRPLRNWLYDRVARNRYAVFGKRDTCRLPFEEEMRHMAMSNEP
jgi:predicted DCC family thiol-disulfide oxidoreductase YuxK